MAHHDVPIQVRGETTVGVPYADLVANCRKDVINLKIVQKIFTRRRVVILNCMKS